MKRIVYLNHQVGANFDSLSAQDISIAVVDPDDSQLTSSQIAALQKKGVTLLSYLSIGEAENYRSYWQNGDWDTTPPSFLLSENPAWEGNYNVKFWDAAWQGIMTDRITELVHQGYNGAFLDVVDCYTVPVVIDAYGGNNTDTRQAMADFVMHLSEQAKTVQPGFKIVPNEIGLLTAITDDFSAANIPYLNAIDGVGIESTWTVNDQPVDWTESHLSYLGIARKACKFVLSIDYPVQKAVQDAYVRNAAQQGFIPFVGTRELDGGIAPANYDIADLLSPSVLEEVKTGRCFIQPQDSGSSNTKTQSITISAIGATVLLNTATALAAYKYRHTYPDYATRIMGTTAVGAVAGLGVLGYESYGLNKEQQSSDNNRKLSYSQAPLLHNTENLATNMAFYSTIFRMVRQLFSAGTHTERYLRAEAMPSSGQGRA